jgi:hypothetical protein
MNTILLIFMPDIESFTRKSNLLNNETDRKSFSEK